MFKTRIYSGNKLYNVIAIKMTNTIVDGNDDDGDNDDDYDKDFVDDVR